MLKTRLTELLGVDHPIISGGMMRISRAELVSAVANAGAFGFLTALTQPTPEALVAEVERTRSMTDRPFGVNLTILPTIKPIPYEEYGQAIIESGVKVVETAGRSPKPLMPKLKDAGIKVIHKMTSIRHAESAQKLGVDAITLIGYGSGGHIGMDNVASFIMIPMAVSRLDIPVIAGGGVADGKGFMGALAMGAEAVLMGTAFFATKECRAHDAIKERLVQTKETETCLILNSIHNPIRCVKNKLADECLALEENNATFEEIIGAVAGGKGQLAYDSGDTEISPIACGQIVGAIDEIKTVKKVIDDIVEEAGILMKRLNAMAT